MSGRSEATSASSRILRESLPALIVAAAVGFATSAAALWLWRGSIDTAIAEHERRITQLETDARVDREIIAAMRADVAWIRGKLEGKP